MTCAEKISIAAIIATVLFGSVAAAFINRFLARADNKSGRRGDFRAFLKGWKMEISAPLTGHDSPLGTIVERYTRRLADFRREAEKARDAVSDTTRFKSMCDKLGTLNEKDLNKHRMPQNVIEDAIDELVNFCA